MAEILSAVSLVVAVRIFGSLFSVIKSSQSCSCTITPASHCKAAFARLSALAFHTRFTWSRSWTDHAPSWRRAFCLSRVSAGALQSISPFICRITKLESPQITRHVRS
ncbi:hypothetical protein PR003_g21129 [Phytophthora rubi]|uniref:Uncharacterized protein n=1 Tax=Phytophthora rubi TaxID=129364 RepID=A0A6A3J4W2_9STRA|nr:hypothetical protein PR001_g23897 [Phytophthora rubi]KAE8990279.1 hypothetical protein PR002_g21197 [Phytophthora rubi]KAE9306907.1 hypothetical protein PR003_g21129 [Phytophthora rubi]